MKRSILCLCMALAGCAVSHQTYAPDGRAAYSINCSGMALTWGACYEKAGDLCGAGGYDILGGGAETSGQILAATQYGLFGGNTMPRSLIVACKRPTS